MENPTRNDTRILRTGVGAVAVAALLSLLFCVGTWLGRFDAGHGGIPIGAMFGSIPLAAFLVVALFPLVGVLRRSSAADAGLVWAAIALWVTAQVCNALSIVYLIRSV